MTPTQAAALVVARAPVPGEAKTRLGKDVGPQVAADLAAAALLDTLDACEGAFGPEACCVALTGDLAGAARGAEIARRLERWSVVPQRGRHFDVRLHHAHLDAAACLAGLPRRTPGGSAREGSGRTVVQVGMDTPQLTAAHLLELAALVDAHDAALGPADDGGWWGLALADPRWSTALVGVPMSTEHTGAQTAEALRRCGAHVALGPWLRDVDDAEDAAAVAAGAPWTRFAGVWGLQGVEVRS